MGFKSHYYTKHAKRSTAIYSFAGPTDKTLIFNGTFDVLEDKEATFTCKATNGYPAPAIHWQLIKNGATIKTFEGDLEISNTTTNRINVLSTLQFTPAREHNQAILRCVVNHTRRDGVLTEEKTLNVRCTYFL